MKRESRLLLDKACNSLLLSIEIFNRPHDRGRVSATLILLDHAFEMLLKASIVHRGGRIREKEAKQTIGFDASVRKALSDGSIRFITAEQALTLQTINGLRDASQHDILFLSEGQLYIYAQAGVTLFSDIIRLVFDRKLIDYLPERVLPISTTPPVDLTTLFATEVSEIRKLLQPGKRRRVEAIARLRPLAIVDAAIRGEKDSPADSQLRDLGMRLVKGEPWSTVFAGVSAVKLSPEGSGPSVSLRLTKNEGIPVHFVKEGTPDASVVAVKRVNELDYYSLGLFELADKSKLTPPKTLAVIMYLGLQGNPDYFREFRIKSQKYKRYSQKALDAIITAISDPKFDLNDIWRNHGVRSH